MHRANGIQTVPALRQLYLVAIIALHNRTTVELAFEIRERLLDILLLTVGYEALEDAHYHLLRLFNAGLRPHLRLNQREVLLQRLIDKNVIIIVIEAF